MAMSGISRILLASAVLLGWAAIAHAQDGNCPPGEISYGGDPSNPANCGPDPARDQQSQRRIAPPPPRWANRWGALASDDAAGVLGAATDAPNKHMAEDGALEQCQIKGGKNCREIFNYHNQCAVMIVGTNSYRVTGGPTIANATALGMKTCRSENASCRVYYTGCSYPVRIQ